MEKKKGLSILIGCLMFLTCFFSFGAVNPKKASAAHSDYIGQDCIYYFCDLYPSLTDDSVGTATGPDLTVLLDRQPVSDVEFSALVNSGYFSNISDCIVVLDFKTLIPSALGTLVDSLKDNDCTVILVTAEFHEFNASGLDIDEHYESDLQRFDAFLTNALRYIMDTDTLEGDVQILIDGNFITDGYVCYEDESIQNCPFATMFFDKLMGPFDFQNSNPPPYAYILKHAGGSSYIDLMTYSDTPKENVPTYAFGCWAMDSDFYNELMGLQNSGLLKECFVMEGSPITYSNPGLRCINEFNLASMYGYEVDESTDVRNLLYPYI